MMILGIQMITALYMYIQIHTSMYIDILSTIHLRNTSYIIFFSGNVFEEFVVHIFCVFVIPNNIPREKNYYKEETLDQRTSSNQCQKSKFLEIHKTLQQDPRNHSSGLKNCAIYTQYVLLNSPSQFKEFPNSVFRAISNSKVALLILCRKFILSEKARLSKIVQRV